MNGEAANDQASSSVEDEEEDQGMYVSHTHTQTNKTRQVLHHPSLVSLIELSLSLSRIAIQYLVRSFANFRHPI